MSLHSYSFIPPLPPGPRVLDDILSPLLSDLSSSSSERSEVALDGLRQVMAVKSRVVLPHLVPQLIQPPVNIRALALLTSVAGQCSLVYLADDTLPYHFVGCL